MVAQRTVNALVGGSNPSPRAKTFFGKTVDGGRSSCRLSLFFRCDCSSTVEQRPFKPLVPSSNLGSRTTF